jgi:hypothetical protein
VGYVSIFTMFCDADGLGVLGSYSNRIWCSG